MIDQYQKEIMCIGGPLHLQVQAWDSRTYLELVVAEPGTVNVLRPRRVKHERVRSLAERFLTIPWHPFKKIDVISIEVPFDEPITKRRRYRASIFGLDGLRRCYYFIDESIKDGEALRLTEDSDKARQFFYRNAWHLD